MINTFYIILENKMIQSLNLLCIVFRFLILYFYIDNFILHKDCKKSALEKIYQMKNILKLAVI